MSDRPFVFDLLPGAFRPSRCDHHIRRTLGAMKGQFSDAVAYERRLAEGDPVLYEVYELKRPAVAGELAHGISVVHPGRVGNEFFMTKGHFHEVLDTAEIYHCLAGEGRMVMETPEGEWAVETLRPGRVLYVPPRWAHRSVNTDATRDLVTLFVYPGHAGHDYGTIERHGFLKLVVASAAGVEVVDNPRRAAASRRPGGPAAP